MKFVGLISAAFGAMAATVVLSAPAEATPTTTHWYVIGGMGNKGCSEACRATATITFVSSGILEVQLSDTEANPKSAGDLLSGIIISLGESAGPVSLTSQSGPLINVTGNNNGYTTVSGSPTHWGVGSSGDDITLETAGNDAQGGEPTNMIIGQPNGSGNYSNANSSVDDGHFSPYILGTGIFFIHDAALTLPPDITGVVFAFGTSPDTFLKGVPEPLTLSLFGTGLAGAVAMRRRRKAKA